MNLVLVRSTEISPERRVVLRDRRARHIAEVLAAQPGDTLRAGVVRGGSGVAMVVTCCPERVELQVGDLDQGSRNIQPPRVSVILAMPRPKVLSRVLRTVSSFGIARIDIVNAWRVDKAYFSSKRLLGEALERELWLGCEQGETTWLPDVAVHPLLMPFLDAMPSDTTNCQRIIAHPHAQATSEQVVQRGPSGEIVVAIGPEGGWIERELDSFADRGFRAVSVGPRVLHVEAAITALLAQLSLLARL